MTQKERRTTEVRCYSLPLGLGAEVEQAAKADNRPASNWVTQAIREKLAREGRE